MKFPKPKLKIPKPTLPKLKMPMKKVVTLAIIAVIAIFSLVTFNKHFKFEDGIIKSRKKVEIKKTSLSDIPMPVKGYRMMRVDFSDTLPALGTVKGYRDIELRFASSGYIEYINFRDGEKAIEGDIIGSLDQREALLKLEYSKNDLERNQKLLDIGSIIEGKLQQSKLEYQSSRLEYEKTNLIAPFDGYVGTVQKQRGDFVTPNDVFGTFVNLTDAYLEFGVIEKDINKVRAGQPVTMTVDSYPQDTFHGELESISPVVEGRTRTFKVKARIVNEDEKLKAGMFGRIGITIYEKDHTLVIPASAFRKKEQEYFVFVIHPEGEFDQAIDGNPLETSQENIQGSIEVRPIQIAYATPDAVEIKAGLDEGELIVTDIQSELEEKAKVEVTEVQEYIF